MCNMIIGSVNTITVLGEESLVDLPRLVMEWVNVRQLTMLLGTTLAMNVKGPVLKLDIGIVVMAIDILMNGRASHASPLKASQNLI